MILPINKIINADCKNLITKWNLENVVIITDPPYGIEFTGNGRKGEERKKHIINDTKKYDLSFLFSIKCKLKIIFGASNFPKLLPFPGRWLCWDKHPRCTVPSCSAFELAWMDKNTGYYKIYRVLHFGVINADRTNTKRFHPTQKPIQLMAAIIRDFTKPNDIILDPFCGSGSTCIAAIREGRKYIGIEIDKKYCEITRKRIKAEKQKPLLLKGSNNGTL